MIAKLCFIFGWLIRFFHKVITRKTVGGDSENGELLINHLEALSKKRVLRLRTNGNRFSWKGEVSSMMEAYLFLIMLPYVNPNDMTYHLASDCLTYQVHLKGHQLLVMREKYVRNQHVVDLKLDGGLQQVNVRLLLENQKC
jgi:hypothetical protein